MTALWRENSFRLHRGKGLKESQVLLFGGGLRRREEACYTWLFEHSNTCNMLLGFLHGADCRSELWRTQQQFVSLSWHIWGSSQ